MNNQTYDNLTMGMVEGERDIALCELNHLSGKIEDLRIMLRDSNNWTSPESKRIADEIERIING